jgi:NADPH:quinone reductase-like Zn-dependent oxidoreductase
MLLLSHIRLYKKTMKAYYSTSYGGAETAQYGDYPDPVAGKGQLLVEVKAVSVNPVDYKIKRGDIKFLTGARFPRIYGSDFSGIVRETGAGVSLFKPGDRVYGVTPVIWNRQGALAQLLAVDKEKARIMPAAMSFEEAAAMPIAALTAMNGLRRSGVTEGTNLLINGGTGGVGHFAVQAAKARGAMVTVTCSPGNAELAKKLGADETMGYSREDIYAAGRQFDVILDAYGHMEYEFICRLLKKGGTYATTMIKPFLPVTSFFTRLLYGKRLTSSNLRSKPEDMDEMERLYREKKLIPVIENYFTLDSAGEAFELAEHGKPRGKIIVRI